MVSEYMYGTSGSGVLSSAGDVLEMSVVRGVGGVCDMCMCLAEVGVGGVGVSGLGLGYPNPGGTGGKWDMCLFWLRWCGWEWLVGLGQGLGGWGGVKSVFVLSLHYLC